MVLIIGAILLLIVFFTTPQVITVAGVGESC